ncbi:HK97 gp10 family phage protein [Holdemania massiliensis]|uniref:HK97 gp10 family phage protein n=1 Tax=Holdemania massiliensis TaxID=1468449 RepID=UPI001F067F14|nr:HK97 gp10 family phage protein [Holdemania massiliensis]MCH1940528.1 HK97 gp10 family phage protein [Holdemania massiliensis]
MSDNIFAEFLETLKKLDVDLKESQIKVVDMAMDVMQRSAVQNTPVGSYDKEVNFITSKGEHVHFTTSVARQGGTLRRGWHLSRTYVRKGQVQKYITNNVDYAVYVNNGHRLVAIVDGVKITTGYVPGQFFLESAVKTAERALSWIYDAELRRVKAKHGL